MELSSMTVPPPCWSMCWMTRRETRYIPRTLTCAWGISRRPRRRGPPPHRGRPTSKTDHQSAGSVSAKGAHRPSLPALLTTQSSLPAACSRRAERASHCPRGCG